MSNNPAIKVEDMVSHDKLSVTARKITFADGTKLGVLILRDARTQEVHNILEVTDMAPYPYKLWKEVLESTPEATAGSKITKSIN